ncbi:hypothetical protein SAMN05216388_102127 [Halorientalis persicus]|jgi:DNA-binding response OmpR family regulator|uniref:Halobacterial output domain-containing protein n=1 Tax=Halorientalis persicus TaxID=1367881 RepID=A0A1H8T4E8_9EURY|nr:response regulator [Halorientalis persicus]SEO85827.1 hypothetical protein SAMN05216388_102127 [Halorientalis persicus]
MTETEPVVIVVENNATRAELYELWLEECTVRIALTKRQVVEEFDAAVDVVVLAEEFGDGAAPTVLEKIRGHGGYCEIVTTTPDRNSVFPELDVDHHLTKPVFEDELRSLVDRLARRSRYRAAVIEYYKRTTQLASAEVGSKAGDGDDEERVALERRVKALKRRLKRLQQGMDTDDIRAVLDSISESREPEEPSDDQSKYAPDKCVNCGRKWGVGPGDDPSRGYKRLGSYVWRCTDCGHVQMQTDPSHRRLAPYH